ncbi:MAG: NUDIX domain-containing protein [Nanoarchaeota archaeon]|mgnify:CR=1 FL=1
MKKRGFRPAVFIVVYYLDKKTKPEKPIYLILKRKLHWKGWEFPKGKIEKGESKDKTARREGWEESGLKIFNLKRYNVSGKYLYPKILKDRPQYKGQTYTLFSGEVKKAPVKLEKREHSAFQWLPFEKAVKKLTWNNQKKCLRIVNKFLGKK